MNKAPKVSIIIPTFNSEQYLHECLDSVVNQTLQDIEIIVVDSDSHDKTIPIVEEYMQRDSRIKLIKREKEAVGLSRNAALDVAKGEYIMFVDSDDYLELNACEEAYQKIKKNGDDVVLFDFYEYFEKTQTKKSSNSKLKFLNSYKTGESFHFWDINGKFVQGTETWYKIYKKSFLDKNKIRFSNEVFGEDVAFYWEVIIKANTFSILNKRLYNYRLCAESSCTSKALSCWKDIFSCREKVYQEMKHSEHSDTFLRQFFPYYINSVMYWYHRWKKIKGFPRKEYYERMHALFYKLREEYKPLLKEIQKSIDDYKRFKRIAIESWRLHKLRAFSEIFYKKTAKDNKKTVKILSVPVYQRKTEGDIKTVKILGIKHQYNKKKQSYQKLSKRYEKHIVRIKKKIESGQKIRVAFYVNDTRWKCQNLFDLMQESKYYEPFVLVGRGAFKPGHQEYQDINTLKALFEFFVSKHMKTELAYNVEKCCYIPLSEFKPDVIFYSRPFGVAHVHDVPETSKFALSCYVPYFISNSPTWVEAKGYFQNHLWKYFLINQDLQNEYAVDMANKGKNLAVVGYPLMESYIGYKPLKNRKNYVIYAPHWSVGDTTLKYATFDWNGKFMLEFAKKHSEIKWVFKPHPILKGKLVESGLMTPEEVEQYWQEWDKIGIKYEGPDYLDLFKQSRALITDCGSFLAEYMPTQNPVVLLRSKNATPYNFLAQKVTKFYYSVWNLEELKEKLDTIILKGQDPWKERRLAMLKSLQLVTNASENIINVLNKEFNIK